MTDSDLRAATPAPLPPALTPEEAEKLAREAGLNELGSVPPFGKYLRDLWANRHLIWALSSSQAYSANQNNYLGQLWAVINPILLVASYYFIFGFLVPTRGGTDNYLGFLTIGIFVFGYAATSMTQGAKAVTGNIGLVRALQFPRALLPISVTLTQLLSNLPSFAVLMLAMPLTGEPVTVWWLLFPVALLFQTMINLGFAFILARIVDASRDIANLVPVVVRLARYVSGVFFSIAHYAAGHAVLGAVLLYQPLAAPINAVRESLMAEYEPQLMTWLACAFWAVALAGAGLVFFWRGEGRYGAK
ncbi:MAG TPA: ABC transporter permease [Intrasporangium sp.]|uniref:ABC transporter permease n=1 Tax=Intrasporangium sp. TaxID=1925024 RepID=UPI002B48E8DC|nr:ABC transporter permease [Intrasporangium sp.]HKX67827.1 ABC transporter permease [Intrasporangium sp.]